MANAGERNGGVDLARYRWTYAVTIGELHPGHLPTKEEAERQLAADTAFLNRCLKDGQIIAKTQSAGVFAVGERGEHQLVTGSVTFILGFARRPYWLPDTPHQDDTAAPVAPADTRTRGDVT